jgi:hypothetical protein
MAGEEEELRPGPLLRRAIAMQGKPFDYGNEPNWRDESPHELCQTMRADYPEPRACSAFANETRCHLGHPANCHWLVDSMVATAAGDGEQG